MQIYKITNLIDGKFYIGKTVKTLEERFRRHLIRKSSPKLTNAIRKYGKQNFIIEMIELCDSIGVLNEREKFWIKKIGRYKYRLQFNHRGRWRSCCR